MRHDQPTPEELADHGDRATVPASVKLMIAALALFWTAAIWFII